MPSSWLGVVERPVRLSPLARLPVLPGENGSCVLDSVRSLLVLRVVPLVLRVVVRLPVLPIVPVLPVRPWAARARLR